MTPDLENYKPIVIGGKLAHAIRLSAKEIGVTPERYTDGVVSRWAALEHLPENEFIAFMRGGTHAGRTERASRGTHTGAATGPDAGNGRTSRNTN